MTWAEHTPASREEFIASLKSLQKALGDWLSNEEGESSAHKCLESVIERGFQDQGLALADVNRLLAITRAMIGVGEAALAVAKAALGLESPQK